MADFANYTPGEYAKEHIRITPTTLADGRDFFYLDDDPEFVSGAKTRELKDPRPLDYRFAPHLDADGIAKADDPFQALKETLDALPDETMKKRVRHVVTEIERVRSFVRAFAQGDIKAAGRLFNASHDSLAADYEVTVPELDVAVDVARKNGAYGARMTGGGFGGSIIALVDKGRSQEVAQKIADEFENQGFHAPRALAAYAAPSASREA